MNRIAEKAYGGEMTTDEVRAHARDWMSKQDPTKNLPEQPLDAVVIISKPLPAPEAAVESPTARDAVTHTPGPWRTGEGIAPLGRNRVWSGTALDIPIAAVISHSTMPADIDPEAQANAKLIAAAPDLLAALETIQSTAMSVAVLTTCGERNVLLGLAKVARAAISRAEKA